uniref:Secretory peptide n=1 Tax=Heteropoda venatoria TaxID=152925 RepID=A0A088BPN3_HETVE|nr:secretory peptide [Heteropoda venatoria]
MKITILALFLVAFVAAALAENAASDVVQARDCGTIWHYCGTDQSECCEGWKCSRQLCKYVIDWGK